MIRSLVSAVLLTLSVAACAREPQPATAPATHPASAEQLAAPAATPGEAVESQQATAAQESASGGADEGRGDAALTRLAAVPANQQLPAGRWTAGVNYQPLVPPQPTNTSAEQVEVLELFGYGCPHCATLQPFMDSWQKSKPAYIKFEQLPAWGGDEARLFYTIEALGRRDLHVKVFKTIHPEPGVKRYDLLFAPGDDAQTLELQHHFAEQNGISAKDFDKARQSFSMNTNLKRADALLRRYSDFYEVGTVPSVVVNGKYVTDVGRAGGTPASLLQLINDLAASEKRR